MEMDAQLRRVLRHYFRFGPSPLHAVTYYLPLLISGKPLPPAADPLIHRTDVYAWDPTDLAARFDPVPLCGDTGDRFFFTPCKRLRGRGNRSQRIVGDDGGSWVSQRTKPINDAAGVMVGEHKTLVFFTKADEKTDWLMDEYRCFPCPQEALVAGGEMVMCKIHTKKKPTFVAAGQPACPKKTPRTAVQRPTPPVVHQDRPPVFTPPPTTCPSQPVCSPDTFMETPAPAPTTAEVDDDDTDRYVCTIDELLGVCGGAVEDEAENIDIDQFATSLEDDLCGAQDEQALPAPADDKQPEQLPPPPPFTTDELNEILSQSQVDEFVSIQDELPENLFPLIDDLQELNDFSSFAVSDSMFGGGEQQAVSTSGELLERYKAQPMFTLDQLEGHNEFVSYAAKPNGPTT